jgi:uncharacterized protein YjbI with pentapeptide repeats
MREGKDDGIEPDWALCAHCNGCIGIPVGSTNTCLAHLDEDQLAAFLEQLHPGVHVDVRGTRLSEDRLKPLLAAVTDDRGYPQFGHARFDGARFERDARFMQAQFSQGANFLGTQFSGLAYFNSAQFGEQVNFSEARFDGPASFCAVDFAAEALFLGARFSANTGTSRSQWRAGTTFFDHGAFFTEARFCRHAAFDRAQFSGPAGFDHVEFEAEAQFTGVQFGPLASFVQAQFKGAERMGPLSAAGEVVFDKAVFDKAVQVEIAAAALTTVRTTFRAGATIRARFAAIAMDGAVFPHPVTLAAAPPLALQPSTPTGLFTSRNDDQDNQAPRTLDETVLQAGKLNPRPQVVSLRGVDVANLVLTDIDLGSCLFAGAHHLDQLRLEGPKAFADAPRGLHTGRAWPPVWWWTRRQTLAEERRWRGTRRKHNGWVRSASQPPEWLAARTDQPPALLGPERVGALYRALRKAHEDSKHEPGAADFYYGEMEMRRHARSTPWGERVILGAYWLTSGYGLRGLRALGCLAVLIVLLGVLFQQAGFDHAHPPLWVSLVYTAQSTVSLETRLRSLPQALTWQGEVLRILLRLTGPVLLGLALLSIRNRVKR